MQFVQFNQQFKMSNVNYVSSTRRILEGVLTGSVYRDAGEIPDYEDPIYEMTHAVGFYNMTNEEQERLTSIVLAAYDNRDYPGRGTMPAIEQPIQTMMVALAAAIQMSMARVNRW